MLVGALCLSEGMRGGGSTRGAHPGVQRADRLVSKGGVVGQGRELAGALDARRDGSIGEARGIGCVESSPLARQQVVVDRLRQKRVAEPVAIAARGIVGDQDLGGERLPQRTLDLSFLDAGHRRQQGRFGGPTGHRGHAQDVLGVLGQRRHARQQDVAQGRRKSFRRALGTGRQQLLHEEGIALRPFGDGIDQAGRRLVAEDGAHLRRQFRVVEPRDLGPLDPGRPLHLREPGPERMAPVEVVAAVRADDRQTLGSDVPDEE